MLRLSWKYVVCGALAVSLVGCAEQAGDRPKTVPVTGKITQNGQGVEGATVSFGPTSADAKAASGLTDASGEFELTTFESGDGAVPGSYAVTVRKMSGAAAPASSGPPPDPRTASKEELEAYYAAGAKQAAEGPAESKHLLPEKYAMAGTSGLTAEVTDGGDNNFEFELTE